MQALGRVPRASPTVSLDTDQASTSGRPSPSWSAPTSRRHQHHHQQCQHHQSRNRDVRARGKQNEFSLWRGETPIPKSWSPGVVAGARTVATPLLSPSKVVERLQTAVHETAAEHFGAFYSSELGGIVTDPAMMFIHMDDHMVHRGHGVFDTVLITDGHAYQLDRHLARFQQSAKAAGLSLPKSEDAIIRIILDTAAASRKLNGIVKYWLTAGRGGFGLSSRECTESGFYAMATSETIPKMKAMDRLTGFRGCTSTIPPNEHPFSTVKSSNYLRNALLLLQAESGGYDVGLFVNGEGHVQEGPNMNLGIITQEGVLITPPAEGCLAGVTMQRLLELIPEEAARSPQDVLVTDIKRQQITLQDLLEAREAFLTGSTLRVMPLVAVNEEIIGDGTPSITTLALDAMLVEDMKVTESGPTPRHIPLPYGFMTGMKDQLI